MRGRVVASGFGAERVARAGEAVAVGDLLESAGGSAQLLFADETVMNLAPDTSVRILQYSFDPERNRRTAVVKVGSGQARFIVAARTGSRFTVESRQATVAVAAAADLVMIASPEESIVTVLAGSATVKNISSLIVTTAELRANQSAAVTATTPPSHPAQITAQQRKAYRSDARLPR